MKSLWKCFALLAVLVLAVSACGPAPAPATEVVPPATVPDAPTLEPTLGPVNAGLATADNPIVTAVKVASIPAIDANWAPPDAKNETWKDAPVTQIGGMQWQAVYTDTDLAILIKWIDRDLSMDYPGTYTWDPASSSWSQFEGPAREWMNLAWDINSSIGTEGCNAFCHEDPPGSGVFHHQTAAGSEYADSWMLFEKHGFSQKPGEGGVQTKDAFGLKTGAEDQFWFMGNISAVQNSPLIFESTTAKNPSNIIAGSATFVDYAEDNIIASPGNPLDSARDRPRDEYCIQCHTAIGLPYNPLALDYTYPDQGETKYAGNWEVPFTSPAYIETNPSDYVDAMILTQAEVDNGEAVAVAGLTPEQVSNYWAAYQALGAKVPTMVLKTPSSSMADVLVGSNWNNGLWTMEITRKLVTPNAGDDVQFKDLSRDYAFSLTITNSNMLLGPLLGQTGGFLHFKQ